MKTNRTTKIIISIIMAVLLVISACVTAFAEGDELVVNAEAKPAFATLGSGGLYAHAQAGSDSAQAWQLWENFSGMNANTNYKYLFLPATAQDDKVELYNNYSDDVTIGNVTIPSGEARIIDYTDGASITVRRPSRTYTMVIRKSDAEASVYVNDTTNSYVDYEGVTQNTDFYSFLIQNKENSVKGSDISIVGDSGITDTTLKKIKGRGNTNWKYSDKKPFNLTFNSAVTIGHTSGKKFSFVSNYKDSTMLRNSIMCDLANDVGNPYAPNTSFIDFYVNGVYRGCYIATDKVDLGKSSLVALKDESGTKAADFSFLVEVDVWNYKNDVYFVTDRDYPVVLKTPDLEDFEAGTEDFDARYNYIKNTYQSFEDVLYNGTLSELEQICDLDSLATMYLLQEFGKNCDGGYTSTYFAYNAAEGKFYAAPIWDCDSDLGAVDCVRDGCSTSTCNTVGFTTRLATFNGDVNPYGKAFTTSGTTADGKTFEDIVSEVWNERFLPAVDVLMGKSASNGRLKSIDEYAASVTKAGYNNYIKWDFAWYCSWYSGTGLSNHYSSDYSGELSYLKDWTQARANWLSTQYKDSSSESGESESGEPEVPDGKTVVYFRNSLGWENVNYFVWYTEGKSGVSEENWPGKPAEYIGRDVDGTEIYRAKFDSTYKNIIFNEGSSGTDQTVDIALSGSGKTYTATNSYEVRVDGVLVYNVNTANYADSPIIGDADTNGRVSIKDATAIQLYLLNHWNFTNAQIAAADTTKDSNVSIRDVTMIQLYLAGLATL